MNRGCFSSYLHKIGPTDSPLCSLDNEVADLDYILFGWKCFCNNGLWDVVMKASVQFPTYLKMLHSICVCSII